MKPIKAWYPSSQTSLFCNSEIRWSRKLSRGLVFLLRLPNGLFRDTRLNLHKRYEIKDGKIPILGCLRDELNQRPSLDYPFRRSDPWSHFEMTRALNPLTCYRNFLSCRKWSIIKIRFCDCLVVWRSSHAYVKFGNQYGLDWLRMSLIQLLELWKIQLNSDECKCVEKSTEWHKTKIKAKYILLRIFTGFSHKHYKIKQFISLFIIELVQIRFEIEI